MTAGEDVQLVAFRVGGQDFAFNIFQVERILRYEAPQPLPKAPDYLEGVLEYQKRKSLDAAQRGIDWFKGRKDAGNPSSELTETAPEPLRPASARGSS